MSRDGDFPLLPDAIARPYPLGMSKKHVEAGRILLFVRRVMPNATEAELIEASDRVREYAAFVIRLQKRIERDRQAAIRGKEGDGVESIISSNDV